MKKTFTYHLKYSLFSASILGLFSLALAVGASGGKVSFYRTILSDSL